jgi:hypothetical protein
MFNAIHNLAIFCPVNNELITPSGDFIAVPKALAAAAKNGNAAPQARRMIKHWAVSNQHLNKGCEIAMFT